MKYTKENLKIWEEFSALFNNEKQTNQQRKTAMITKKIYPVGNIREVAEGDKKVNHMNIVKMIAEYRLFGILLYKKELINPSFFKAEYYEDFIVRF